MLIVSIVFAVVMLGVVGAVYQFGIGAVVFTLAVLGFLIFFGTMSPLLLGTWLLLALIAVACRCAGASVKKFVTWSVAAMLLTHATAVILMMQPMQDVLELRREYPIESLRHRLAYEQRALAAIEKSEQAIAASPSTDSPRDAQVSAPVAANSEQSDRLAKLEDRLDVADWHDARRALRYRRMALERLYSAHQSAVNEFVNSPGFGVGRMGTLAQPTREHIEMPPALPVPQPQIAPDGPLPSSDEGAAPLQAVDSTPSDASPMQNALADLHLDGTIDFTNPLGFGYVRDLDHTIGFEPHTFSQLPRVSEANHEMTGWKIGKLELVSLLRHEQPQVYQSSNLPNMQELEAVPTRSLDQFESGALDKLRRGEDLVVASGSSETRMLGSLRAAKQCLQCHQVDRGALLGAFTYRLFSDDPDPQPKADKPPRKPAS